MDWKAVMERPTGAKLRFRRRRTYCELRDGEEFFKHEMHETHEMIFYNLIFRNFRVFRDYNSKIHEWALELSINQSARIRLIR